MSGTKDIDDLRMRFRVVVSHATAGGSSDIDRSVNDICVQISATRNRIYQQGKDDAARDALKAKPTPALNLGDGARDAALDQPTFTNCVRSLFNIDSWLLPELTSEQQGQFIRDPVRYFIGTDKTQQDAIWREVSKRQVKA